MVTETKTTEQADGAEKQVLDALLEAGKDVLEEAEPVLKAEDEAVPPVAEEQEPAKTFSQEEFEAELEKQVNAEADSRTAKSLVTYQKTQDALKREIAELREAARREKEEVDLARQEGREKETWEAEGIPLPVIEKFQAERKANNMWIAQVKTAYQSFVDKDMVEAKEAIKSSTALKLAIQYGLPDGGNIVKQLEAFVKEIGEGKSDAEMELKALRSSLKVKEKKPVVKLDSNRLSATGGRDLSKLSGEELLREAVAEDRRKGL